MQSTATSVSGHIFTSSNLYSAGVKLIGPGAMGLGSAVVSGAKVMDIETRGGLSCAVASGSTGFTGSSDNALSRDPVVTSSVIDLTLSDEDTAGRAQAIDVIDISSDSDL